LAAKPLAPKVPLPVLLAASEVNELLYFLFTATGVEQPAVITMSFSEGVRHLTPGVNPWSHGLLMSVVWSLAAAAVAWLVYRDRRTAGVIGLTVLSHWGLDFLMHSNLPLLFDGSPLVGLGLENTGSGFAFMTILDLVLVAGGLAVYLVKRRRTNQAICNPAIRNPAIRNHPIGNPL
jgi:hypothetical protein